MNISIEVNDKDLIIDILRIAYDLDVDAEEIPKITAPTTEKVEEKEAVEELVEEKTDEEPVDTSPTWHGHGSPALTPQELYETQKKGENNVGLTNAEPSQLEDRKHHIGTRASWRNLQCHTRRLTTPNLKKGPLR